jgi:hypothetical protein
MRIEEDVFIFLPKDKAVCCSVCNFQYKIIPSHTVTEHSGKPFQRSYKIGFYLFVCLFPPENLEYISVSDNRSMPVLRVCNLHEFSA